jgi:plasmid stabilization system protein ParE
LKRIRWTPAAVADLEQIGDYLREHNPSLAQPTMLKLYQTAQSLRRFPNRGRTGQLAGTAEIVHIARVLHGAQDWRKQSE